MSILIGSCIVTGVVCLIYYAVITIYAGIGTAFACFWIMAGMGLLVLGLLIKYVVKNEIKIPEIIRYLLITAVAAGAIIFLLLEGTIIYYSNQEAEPNVDYLIVLGAQVRATTITKSLKKRLDTAVQYLNENPQTQVIVSGGKGPGEDISEAAAMRQYLLSRGIEEIRILKEEKSTNTNENIGFSKQLMKDQNSSVAIVTNGFHIFRSISIAKKQGLAQAQGLAASSDRILLLNYYVREAFGVLKDYVFGNI